MPKTVERCADALDRQTLLALAVRQEPRIFTNLFDGQPVRKLAAAADLPPWWAEVRIVPTEPEEQINIQGTPLPPTTVREFLRDHKRGIAQYNINPSPDFMQLPAAIAQWGASAGFKAYMAHAGVATHLHFDANCQHNMHYQVLARKRFILFGSERSKDLAAKAQSSRLFLERLPERERLELVGLLGGYECVLEPGESLFVPAFMWHYVDYFDEGLSLSTRFGMSNRLRSLLQRFNRVHPTVEFAHFAMGLLGDECTPEYERAYLELSAAWDKSSGTAEQRFWLMQEALEAICKRLCPERVAPPLFDPGPEVFPLFHFGPAKSVLVRRP
jgi:Cupin-like domain